MKRYNRIRAQRFAAVGLLSFLACLGGVLVPSAVVCQNSVADEIISLNVTAQSLGEVLENISAATGCRFSIDSSWEDYPVTASFQNKPLQKALKIILHNLNNAVIYGSERTVKILIYDESASSEKAGRHSVVIGSSAESVPSVSPDQEATAPQPEVPMPEDSSPPEAEQSPDENTESVSEGRQAGDGNQEVREEGAARNADSGSEVQPGASGENERQTEEAEPASENAANTEGNQETSEN
jgi:hypothetical protein